MSRSREAGAIHIIALVFIAVVLVFLWQLSRINDQIGYLQQDQEINHQRIADMESRVRMLESKALQEKVKDIK